MGLDCLCVSLFYILVVHIFYFVSVNNEMISVGVINDGVYDSDLVFKKKAW